MQLAGVKTGLLMNFNVTNLKSGIKRLVLLLRALRVLRGKTILCLGESLGALPFFFSYPLETTKSGFRIRRLLILQATP